MSPAFDSLIIGVCETTTRSKGPGHSSSLVLERSMALEPCSMNCCGDG